MAIRISVKFLWATEYITSAWWTIVILIGLVYKSLALILDYENIATQNYE